MHGEAERGRGRRMRRGDEGKENTQGIGSAGEAQGGENGHSRQAGRERLRGGRQALRDIQQVGEGEREGEGDGVEVEASEGVARGKRGTAMKLRSAVRYAREGGEGGGEGEGGGGGEMGGVPFQMTTVPETPSPELAERERGRGEKRGSVEGDGGGREARRRSDC